MSVPWDQAGARSRAAAAWHRKEPVEVIWVLIRILLGGFCWRFSRHIQSGRRTHKMLERLYFSSGLGTPEDPPRGAGNTAKEEGNVDREMDVCHDSKNFLNHH